MRIFYTWIIILLSLNTLVAQHSITGQILNDKDEFIMFANVALYPSGSNDLVKVEITDEKGMFSFKNLKSQSYRIETSYIGFKDIIIDNILLDKNIDLGVITLESQAIELEAAEIVAERALVESKADRTIFNVQGTVNSAGDNGLELLRKAPGVIIDNNDNITVMSRNGVLIYVNGKRLPLKGEDLTNYLQNLTAAQIDKIEIITNPGAKYEAEGNAGIIDIVLKKDDTIGANGSVSTQFSKGKAQRGGINANGNYRSRNFNVFGNVGYNLGERYHHLDLLNALNDLVIHENNTMRRDGSNYSYQLGTDYFINKYNTIGFLIDGNVRNFDGNSDNKMKISTIENQYKIDSLLISNNKSEGNNTQNSYNLNYQYRKDKRSLNMDLDYGYYNKMENYHQPNRYYLPDEETLLAENITEYETPSTIKIWTVKVDYEQPIWRGIFSTGIKYSYVDSDNEYKFYNLDQGQMPIFSTSRSNDFFYNEKVLAGYLNYQIPLSKQLKFSGGLRSEYTDIEGNLKAYQSDLQEEPVIQDYTKFFPSVGLSYTASETHNFNINYGKRINRPDYNVLNPFTIQMSELSYRRGNARLKPEIVHNFDFAYTLLYRYSLKMGYSKTYDQITRLRIPDEQDPRASSMTWANLAEQQIISATISIPLEVKKWWNAYMNFTVSQQKNNANFGINQTIDLTVNSFNMFQQHTFTIHDNLKAELSGWYESPGIWGGVFLYEENWSLNIGIQNKFLNEKLLAKISFQDIFNQAGWSGTSSFGGLEGRGMGNWDSRRISLSLSYSFGSSKIKKSRNRTTGIDEAKKRTSGGAGSQGGM